MSRCSTGRRHQADLVDYLDAVSGLILPELRGRPLSVIRVRAGQQPFMQKNLRDYAPAWVGSVTLWAESSRRECATRFWTTGARCCGWPTSGRWSTTHASLAGDWAGRPTWCWTSTGRPAAVRAGGWRPLT